jgi:hypothetical protein
MELVREEGLPKKDTKFVRDGILSGGILKEKHWGKKRKTIVCAVLWSPLHF